MGVALNPSKYGRLCAAVVPKVIETDEEFDRMVAQMEALDRKANPTPEEEALSELVMKLIQDYDDRHFELPRLSPHEMVLHLMEHKGLRQADLVPVFGSRSVASDVLNGKRQISKAHARKLADFFHLPADLFI